MSKTIFIENCELLEIIEAASVLKVLSLTDEEKSPGLNEYLDGVAENLYSLAYDANFRETEETCCCDEPCSCGVENENNPAGLVIAIGLSEMDKKQMGHNFVYLTMNPYPDAIPEESKTYLVKTAQDKYSLMYYNKIRGTWADPNDDYFDCPEGYVCAWLELI